MSVAAIRRSFAVVHHLQMHGEARFTDLVHLLSPISRTALSHLLTSLEEIGELEREGRWYRLATSAATISGDGRCIYALPPALRAETNAILERTARHCGHSCALFARVGGSTMKIMDEHNVAYPHWPFAPIGCEWPLVPFHGFARVFLAYAPESVARECYRRWAPYLQPNPRLRLPENDKSFLAELGKLRRHGYAIEYKDEVAPLMRVALPVFLADHAELRFAVGIVANFVYLLEVDACVESLRMAARDLAEVLKGRVPGAFTRDRETEDVTPMWTEFSPNGAHVQEFRPAGSGALRGDVGNGRELVAI